MPFLHSDYKAPFFLINGHLETVIPSLVFKVADIPFFRERLELSDGDFLDLDWLRNGNSKCLIVTHGLEGSSDRYYVKRTAKYFHSREWDILAWNCRSCSGELNRLPRFYHHGDTEDLLEVIHRADMERYESIVLFGYSMGGSMSLKLIGENRFPESVKGAATFSVPCNLRDSAFELSKRSNRFYEKRFLKKLLKKVEAKAAQHPEILERVSLKAINDFDEFHRFFTVPLHGFKNLDDFFNQATCDQYFHQIKIPVLIANANNDPLLGKKCYPVIEAIKNPNLFLEMPERGGHTGFTLAGKGHSWMEVRANRFISQVILPSAQNPEKQS